MLNLPEDLLVRTRAVGTDRQVAKAGSGSG